MFKIPFSLVPTPSLKNLSHKVEGVSEKLRKFFPFLEDVLKHAELPYTTREYIGMCLLASSILFMFFFFLAIVFLILAGLLQHIVVAFIICFLVVAFIFFQQVMYPRLIVRRRIRGIERNLMAALQSILVQVNSGIPLFDVLVNISVTNYGEVSIEFGKAVREILAGEDEIEALEKVGSQNPSVFFRRTIWQLVNGMKAGSEISDIIKELIGSLGEEQLIQIQRFGSQLNPLAMFYMLVGVIGPSLGLTFIIILASFIGLGAGLTKLIFWILFGSTTFMQLMFLGIIKARRPNLLG